MVKRDSHYVKLLTNIVALLLYLLCITDIVFANLVLLLRREDSATSSTRMPLVGGTVIPVRR